MEMGRGGPFFMRGLGSEILDDLLGTETNNLWSRGREP